MLPGCGGSRGWRGNAAGKQPLTLHPSQAVQVLGEVPAFLGPLLELNRPFLPLASSTCVPRVTLAVPGEGTRSVFRTLFHAQAALVAM